MPQTLTWLLLCIGLTFDLSLGDDLRPHGTASATKKHKSRTKAKQKRKRLIRKAVPISSPPLSYLPRSADPLTSLMRQQPGNAPLDAPLLAARELVEIKTVMHGLINDIVKPLAGLASSQPSNLLKLGSGSEPLGQSRSQTSESVALPAVQERSGLEPPANLPRSSLASIDANGYVQPEEASEGDEEQLVDDKRRRSKRWRSRFARHPKRKHGFRRLTFDSAGFSHKRRLRDDRAGS